MLLELWRFLSLDAGYNAAVVLIGAALLGAGGGVVGCFGLLRKRSLLSDAVSHATLPGIALAFIALALLTGQGRQLHWLMLGAAGAALLAVLAVAWIKDHTRLPEDSAIGTVLATFFGLGTVLLSVIQVMRTGGQAGLEGLLLGSAAGMLLGEAQLVALAALIVTAVALLFLKEFGLVAFDQDYARAMGYPVARLDLLMMALLVAVTVIGLPIVGLVLIIAIVIIPAVAARFWTDRLLPMILIAALIGALGGYLGAAISGIHANLPTGGIIVLTLTGLFALSLLFAPRRGVLAQAARYLRFRLAIAERQGLLAVAAGQPVLEPLSRLRLKRRGYLTATGQPTTTGLSAAQRTARDQALWDRYLEDYPDDAFGSDGWASTPIERALPLDLVADLDRRVRSAAGTPG
jgi:manganese/zinc/iron transport system permease protein